MNDVISEIVEEWSKRIPSGIVDHTNEVHLNVLLGVLHEYVGDEEVITNWLENIANIGR